MKEMTTSQKFHKAVKTIEKANGEKLSIKEKKELAEEMEANRRRNISN